MTKSEVLGVARAVLSAAGGFVVARGWLDSESAVALAGALATVVAAVWSVRSKRG